MVCRKRHRDSCDMTGRLVRRQNVWPRRVTVAVTTNHPAYPLRVGSELSGPKLSATGQERTIAQGPESSTTSVASFLRSAGNWADKNRLLPAALKSAFNRRTYRWRTYTMTLERWQHPLLTPVSGDTRSDSRLRCLKARLERRSS